MIHAPFRFAPIHRLVHTPAWGRRVSLDVPFKDGLSGEIPITLTAHTPILIGGDRGNDGVVRPFRLGAAGPYAIPGSTLQGLARSTLEVATFGRLGPFVDNKRFGIRDLDPLAQPYYGSRLNAYRVEDDVVEVTPRVRAGWLRRGADGFHLRRCELARVEYDDLPAVTGARRQVWATASDAGHRFGYIQPPHALWTTLAVEDAPTWHAHQGGSLSILYRKAGASAPKPRSNKAGALVFTGHVAASSKHMEFFFFDEMPEERLPESFAETYVEFVDIHQPSDGRKVNAAWTFYRTQGYPGPLPASFGVLPRPFSDGGWMPIFYIEDRADPDRIDSFGLAYMFKVAHEKTTWDLLANSSEEHCRTAEDPEFRPDLPTLIFGSAADERGGGLRRRATFGWAAARGAPRLLGPITTGLLSPKPSYAGFYVRQPVGTAHGRLPEINGIKAPFATYTPLDDHRIAGVKGLTTGHLKEEHRRPELAGVKIWPAGAGCRYETIEVPHNVAARLQALEAGAVFGPAMLRFHNLRPVELGALLWALTLGDRAALTEPGGALRHRLGMGKPIGLGEVSIRIDGGSAHIRPNDPGAVAPSLESLLTAFEAYMESECAAAAGGSWAGSVQVKSLVRAANPVQQPVQLPQAGAVYMKGWVANPSYATEKRAGAYLPRYVTGCEAAKVVPAAHPTPGAGRGPPARAIAPAPPPAPAGPAEPPGRAAQPGELVVGARVRCVRMDGEPGKIEGIEGRARNRAFWVKLDNGKRLRLVQGALFIVPPSSDPPT